MGNGSYKLKIGTTRSAKSSRKSSKTKHKQVEEEDWMDWQFLVGLGGLLMVICVISNLLTKQAQLEQIIDEEKSDFRCLFAIVLVAVLGLGSVALSNHQELSNPFGSGSGRSTSRAPRIYVNTGTQEGTIQRALVVSIAYE